MRAAGDSVPPLRLAALGDVANHPGSRTSAVTKRLQKPRATVDRVLQELHVLGLVIIDDEGEARGWQYELAPSVHADVLAERITRKVSTPGVRDKEVRLATDKSGDWEASPRPACQVCGSPLDPTLAAYGDVTHPACAA